MVEWQRLDVGIRVRIHPTRRHGALPDRYFVLRYSVDGVKKQEALGWASRGWTLAKAATNWPNCGRPLVLARGQ